MFEFKQKNNRHPIILIDNPTKKDYHTNTMKLHTDNLLLNLLGLLATS